jgi:hypothetical protein
MTDTLNMTSPFTSFVNGREGRRQPDIHLPKHQTPTDPTIFQVSWHVSCGSGFPAATIEAESLSHKKQTY